MDQEREELQRQSCELGKALKSIDENEKALNEKVKTIEQTLETHELNDKVKAMQDAITKTYLTLWFSSEGADPTSVVMRLQAIGFKPTRGRHDFVYDWRRQIKLEEIFQLGDTVHRTLKRLKVLYKLETV